MSSLVRRLQIKFLKQAGFQRLGFKIVAGPTPSTTRTVPVTKGGLVCDTHNNPLGYKWPSPHQLKAA